MTDMPEEIIDNGPDSPYRAGFGVKTLNKDCRTTHVFISQKYPDLMWKDKRQTPVFVDTYIHEDIHQSVVKERDELRALVEVMKGALHAADAMLPYGGKLNSMARDTITKALAAAEKAGV